MGKDTSDWRAVGTSAMGLVPPTSEASAKEAQFYERGFSFFSLKRAARPTPATFTTLKRTPGMSPLALPLRPKPEMSTSSFSVALATDLGGCTYRPRS